MLMRFSQQKSVHKQQRVFLSSTSFWECGAAVEFPWLFIWKLNAVTNCNEWGTIFATFSSHLKLFSVISRHIWRLFMEENEWSNLFLMHPNNSELSTRQSSWHHVTIFNVTFDCAVSSLPFIFTCDWKCVHLWMWLLSWQFFTAGSTVFTALFRATIISAFMGNLCHTLPLQRKINL